VKIIAYYRVSTQRQGASGLGLDAQRSALLAHVSATGGSLLAEYTEIESGRKADRPELGKAVSHTIRADATLVIAKLDRLARNVHFVSGLMETGVKFTALDMPTADRFMLHVYAAMAEEESRRIGQRTRAALAMAKARGTELGKNGKLLAKREREAACRFALTLGPLVEQARESGAASLRQLADALNQSGVLSRHGGRWHPASVARLLSRLADSVWGPSTIGPRWAA
jgi:DNA invertase Pin-like site-specific DNA recombinase